MDMTKGADVTTLEGAEAFIRDFVAALRDDDSGRMRRHSGDYDLFLPWLWEEVVNSGTHLEPAHCSKDASRLFMDAAWSLVQKGHLRPGPPKVSSTTGGGDYGKGFSLTDAGEAWLRGAEETRPALDASPF